LGVLFWKCTRTCPLLPFFPFVWFQIMLSVPFRNGTGMLHKSPQIWRHHAQISRNAPTWRAILEMHLYLPTAVFVLSLFPFSLLGCAPSLYHFTGIMHKYGGMMHKFARCTNFHECTYITYYFWKSTDTCPLFSLPRLCGRIAVIPA